MSSEKPFWEGKTCKEMAGLHVKVTFVAGAVLTGITDGSGHIRRSSNGSGVPISPSRRAERFVPYRDIESIELVDDAFRERITDITKVRPGDKVVMKNGNEYMAVNVRPECTDGESLQLNVEGFNIAAALWAEDSAFSYALRPEPKLPDHDGLWLDKDDAIWQVCDHQAVPVYDDADEWGLQREVFSVSQLGQYAPFRPAKAVEA